MDKANEQIMNEKNYPLGFNFQFHFTVKNGNDFVYPSK